MSPEKKKKEKKPKTLGRYTLHRLIGRGGMGAVYEATVPGEEKTYAVKVLLGAIGTDSPFLERFRREAKASSKLSHPGIVKVHDFGRDRDRFFFAMDYIKGRPLDEVIEGKSLGVKSAAKAIIQVAEALHHAHETGIVHRDVKPSNLILAKGGRVYITDFGIARDESASALTMEGEILGTPFYMSPEQALGRRDAIDRRSDVYSLGVTFYELLTCTTPFRGEAMNEILRRIITEDPVKPSLLNAQVPPSLDTVVMKAIRKDKGKRYPTSKAFADDLRRWIKGEEVLARDLTLVERSARTIQHHKGASVMTALAVVVVLSALGLVIGSVMASASRRADRVRERREKGSAYVKEGQGLLEERMKLPKKKVLLRDKKLREALSAFEKALGISKKNLKAAKGAAQCRDRIKNAEKKRREDQEEARAKALVVSGIEARMKGDTLSADRRRVAGKIADIEQEFGPGIEGAKINKLRQEFARLTTAENEAYDPALRNFSQALFIDPSNKDAHQETAKIFLNRARAVFRLDLTRGDLERVKSLFLTVAFHDRTGKLEPQIASMRRWLTFRRHVSLTVDPHDATLALVRVDLEAGTESAPEPLTRTSIDLPPGSYIIVARRANRVEVRFPIHVSGPSDASDFDKSMHRSITLPKDRPDYRGMVFVHGGPFLMGGLRSARGGPRRKVDVDGFFMDRTEVSHSDYLEFIQHLAKENPGEEKKSLPIYVTTTANPGNWTATEKGYVLPPGWADRPLSGIDWATARAYAAFRHKRLPTHREWEKAARGVDGRLYPWGNRFDERRCFHTLSPGYSANAGWFILHPVSEEPRGASPYGCYHMAGNVAEWTASELYDHKINRGGCVIDQVEILRCGSVDNSTPDSKVGTLGFRCAMDPIK
jgi:formylglycine-generating enzyme required for sulfatase activity/predicted Ser/Thr protein kinase/tetratricopeptide (TPR) repeat protein